jgi:hypothetical protein
VHAEFVQYRIVFGSIFYHSKNSHILYNDSVVIVYFFFGLFLIFSSFFRQRYIFHNKRLTPRFIRITSLSVRPSKTFSKDIFTHDLFGRLKKNTVPLHYICTSFNNCCRPRHHHHHSLRSVRTFICMIYKKYRRQGPFVWNFQLNVGLH